MDQHEHPQHQEEFFPRGSIAFFIILIVFFLAIWFGMYALIIYRG